MKLKKEALLNINGGAFSASFLSAVVRGATLLLELGRSLGTAMRRFISRKSC